MKKILLICFLTLPFASSAQELANENGICFGTIAGLEDTIPSNEREQIIVRCFDDALNQCSLKEDFTACIISVNDSAFAALVAGRDKFDQSSLDTALPGRRMAWNDLMQALAEIESISDTDADSQMKKFRSLFFASQNFNDLRR